MVLQNINFHPTQFLFYGLRDFLFIGTNNIAVDAHKTCAFLHVISRFNAQNSRHLYLNEHLPKDGLYPQLFLIGMC